MSAIEIACWIAYYLIMGYGVFVCWCAYRSSKKKAWLLIGIFCLSMFIMLGMRQLSKLIHRDALMQYQEQQAQVKKTDDQKIPVKDIKMILPIFPFLLVAGLSLLAEDEIKRNQKAQDGESASPVS